VEGAIRAEDFLRPERYEIQQLLRSGRDKKVYLARDRELGCQVTLDVFANNAIMPNGLTVSAWETRVLGHLGDHRNIATVLDHWESGGTAVMVNRYLSGGSLEDLIAQATGGIERPRVRPARAPARTAADQRGRRHRTPGGYPHEPDRAGPGCRNARGPQPRPSET
jgi:hypothetical protein